MLIRKAILASLAAAAIGGVAAPAAASPHIDIRFTVPPPPVRYEVVPAPRYGHVWVPGYWEARHHHKHKHKVRHVWIDGHWLPARHGYYYAPPRWVERHGYWHHERGYWDRDRDGVPNRYDRFPHNPYRR